MEIRSFLGPLTPPGWENKTPAFVLTGKMRQANKFIIYPTFICVGGGMIFSLLLFGKSKLYCKQSFSVLLGHALPSILAKGTRFLIFFSTVLIGDFGMRVCLSFH